MHRKHIFSLAAALVLPLAMLACGGGEQAGEATDGEQAAAQHHAREQLPEHGRLAELPGELAHHPRQAQQHGQRQQQYGDLVGLQRSCCE